MFMREILRDLAFGGGVSFLATSISPPEKIELINQSLINVMLIKENPVFREKLKMQILEKIQKIRIFKKLQKIKLFRKNIRNLYF